MGNAYTVQVISDLARQVIVACKDRGNCLARVESLGIILSELVL